MKFALVALLLIVGFVPAAAQKARPKLPSAGKIVADFVKAVGGKKRLAAITDATYVWDVSMSGAQGFGETGPATTHLRAPSSYHFGFQNPAHFGEGATPRAAWRRGPEDTTVRTLTGAAAKSARLRAALEAGRFLSFKKQNLLAVTVGAEQFAGETAYAVEFRSREGARLRYLFSAGSKLLVAALDEEGAALALFSDYRPVSGVLEPHVVELTLADVPEPLSRLSLRLKSVRYNTNFAETVFNAPASAEYDARALIKEVMEKEPAFGVKFEEYTFTVKQTERELDERGETKKETSNLWEIFMAPNGWSIGKHTLANDKPLPPEKAAKEEKRVADFLTLHANDKPPEARKGAGGFQISFGDGMGFGLADLLRASEFVSPRRERFQDRDAVVFDFRPDPAFRPRNRSDEILSKIVGLVWIDLAEKVVMRIEARLLGDFKIGGGLLMKIQPGAGFTFERRRLPDGYWVPRAYHWNASGRGLVFMKRSVYEITEWDNFKRFRSEAGDAKLDAPKPRP